MAIRERDQSLSDIFNVFFLSPFILFPWTPPGRIFHGNDYRVTEMAILGISRGSVLNDLAGQGMVCVSTFFFFWSRRLLTQIVFDLNLLVIYLGLLLINFGAV